MIGKLINAFTDRLLMWRLIIATLLALLLTYFCAAQTITMAWLASFVDDVNRLEQMRVRLWIFAWATGTLAIVDLLLFAVWGSRIRRVRAARKRELLD